MGVRWGWVGLADHLCLLVWAIHGLGLERTVIVCRRRIVDPKHLDRHRGRVGQPEGIAHLIGKLLESRLAVAKVFIAAIRREREIAVALDGKRSAAKRDT